MRLAVVLLSIVLAGCGGAPPGAEPAPSTALPTETFDVAVAGGSIHGEVAGSGEAVLLIHGGFGDLRMWDGQFAPLAKAYRVVRMDLRGFGQSSFPEAPYAAVDDVAAVLDMLGIQGAHVIGNSMGGALAIDFALAHPKRVTSLTVVASGPNGYPATPEDRARFAADIETIVAAFRAAGEQGLERGAEMWKAQPMVVVANADPRTSPLLHRMIDDNRRIFGMAHWPDDDKRAVGMLAQVRAPALIVVGDRDIALVRAAADYAASGIAGARLVTIPGTDHLPQMEQPERFNALLLEFLQSR